MEYTFGNLCWSEGPDSEVLFVPDPKGKIIIERVVEPGDGEEGTEMVVGIDPYDTKE